MPEILLSERRVLVTGSARGLGGGFARALVAAGARVVVSDVLHERGRALAAELGPAARYVPMDLADPADVQRGVAEAARCWDGLDGLVNNAAITNSGGKTAEQITVDTWDRVMEVNVRGTWLVTNAARPHLAASGSGRIVNIASDTALWGAPRLLAYVASKGAVMGFTRVLSKELGPENITVNAVAPGMIATEGTLANSPVEAFDRVMQNQAIRKRGQPRHLAGLIAFLASDEAELITGQFMLCDGGGYLL